MTRTSPFCQLKNRAAVASDAKGSVCRAGGWAVVKFVDVGAEPFQDPAVDQLFPAANPFPGIGAEPYRACLPRTVRQF